MISNNSGYSEGYADALSLTNQQTQELQEQLDERNKQIDGLHIVKSELQIHVESLQSSLLDVTRKAVGLKEQLEISQLEAKDNLDHANVISHDYAKLKEAADEMYIELGMCFKTTERLAALNNYKHLTNKP